MQLVSNLYKFNRKAKLDNSKMKTQDKINKLNESIRICFAQLDEAQSQGQRVYLNNRISELREEIDQLQGGGA